MFLYIYHLYVHLYLDFLLASLTTSSLQLVCFYHKTFHFPCLTS